VKTHNTLQSANASTAHDFRITLSAPTINTPWALHPAQTTPYRHDRNCLAAGAYARRPGCCCTPKLPTSNSAVHFMPDPALHCGNSLASGRKQPSWHAAVNNNIHCRTGKAWINTAGRDIDLQKSRELSTPQTQWTGDVAAARAMQAKSVEELVLTGSKTGHFLTPNGPPPAERLQLAALHYCQVQQLCVTCCSSEATLFSTEFSTGGRVKIKGTSPSGSANTSTIPKPQLHTHATFLQHLCTLQIKTSGE